jgi:murein DD-endopeptidase MepM/ murein hydrolase activator NlpD
MTSCADSPDTTDTPPLRWQCPLPLRLQPTADSHAYRHQAPGSTGLPLAPHPGAFGVVRANHVHEGVDLYCAEGTAVSAVEDGVVVAVLPFTGPAAGLPWWLDTEAVLVEGASGVVVYGEIKALAHVTPGCRVAAGELLGQVVRVLRHDKGRPVSMLHLELHAPGTRAVVDWHLGLPRPDTLRDPTALLAQAHAPG